MQKRITLLLIVLLALGKLTTFAQDVPTQQPDTLLLQEATQAANEASSDLAQFKPFRPSPMRAVWYSALLPGLGQIYNRQMWKVPIVMGGFVAITYGTTWNNRYYESYARAYKDIVDNDPNTNSYLDFYGAGATEDMVDKAWLTSTLKRGKDTFRRNRDLCIISLVGLYGLTLIDAYVDTELYDFDITPNLSMQVEPALISTQSSLYSSPGVRCAITF